MFRETRNCPHCSEQFIVTAKNRTKKFCSSNCGNTARSIVPSPCIQCQSLTKNPKFCSSSCAATYNNAHSAPGRRYGPKPKSRPLKAKPTKPFKLDHSIKSGEYSRLYHNVCAKTGLVFISKSYQKYHPTAIVDRSDYARQCQFNFQINKFPQWFDGSLIKEHGMYSTPGSNKQGTSNPNGVSRDHMISISFGWENKVDPKLIAHPANCDLVLHRDNQRKKTKSSITVEELQQRIARFETLYPNWLREDGFAPPISGL